MDLNVQKLVMENRVLLAERATLLQEREDKRAEHEKDKAVELMLVHALTGYCSQLWAAEEDGPARVVDKTLETMNLLLKALEGMTPPPPAEPDKSEGPELGFRSDGSISLDPQ